MELSGRVVVVTGGAAGIGRALCRRFSQAGLAGLVVADLDGAGAEAVARECGGVSMRCDVSQEPDMAALTALALSRFGHIDLFCSNAGVCITGDETNTLDAAWERSWNVNVRAHILAARAVLPGMLARGEGYLLQTISAAGLLNQIGAASYGVTKHAAVGFAEWLAIEYGDRGIRVSAICPQGVRTDMLADSFLRNGRKSFLEEGAIEPEAVAEAAVAGIATEQFLILPHPEVREYMQRKTSDYDRWLRGMRRLRAQVEAD
jgi:NAD(P)-dependent dehydrogenase (short-subunit alcohol dehydrogenase family)